MSTTPDFTEAEIQIAQDTLEERYRRDVPVQQAGVEVRPHPEGRELVERPALFWEDGKCRFVVAQMDKTRFHCRFYYGLHQQYGAGRPEYTTTCSNAS